VATQDDVGELFPLQDTEDILDMRVQIDRGAHQMRPLAEARERGREDLMTGLTEQRCDTLPAPATVPSSMH
jgi:hypothetical protein